MIIETIPILQIHKMDAEKYKKQLEAGNIDPNAIYLTEEPDCEYSEVNEFLKLKDTNTGKVYKLQVIDGKLAITEIEEAE